MKTIHAGRWQSVTLIEAMRRSRQCLAFAISFGAGGNCLLSAVSTSHASEASDVVAISATASADYIRTPLPDGSFQTETFVF
jgi:hypothetical protein